MAHQNTPEYANKTIGHMNDRWAKLFKITLATFPILVPIAAGAAKYTYTELADLDKRVEYLEKTEFTAEDTKKLAEDLASIKAELRRLDRIETKVDRLIGRN